MWAPSNHSATSFSMPRCSRGTYVACGSPPGMNTWAGVILTILNTPSSLQDLIDQDQKSQSSSSVTTALPMTYDEPDPEKKSWFSSAFGDSADRIAGFTSVVSLGNIGS